MTSKDLRSKTSSKFRPAYVASAFSLVLSGVSAVAIADAAFAAKPFQVRITREVVRADQLMLQGKYDEAADLYKGEMGRQPKSVAATVGYGMALAKQFKLDAAEEHFNKVLSMDPTNAMAHAGRAMITLNRLTSSSNTVIKNREALLRNAEAECKQALNIDPAMPEERASSRLPAQAAVDKARTPVAGFAGVSIDSVEQILLRRFAEPGRQGKSESYHPCCQ